MQVIDKEEEEKKEGLNSLARVGSDDKINPVNDVKPGMFYGHDHIVKEHKLENVITGSTKTHEYQEKEKEEAKIGGFGEKDLENEITKAQDRECAKE